MAELNEAFNKIETQQDNNLFCFYSRVPIFKNIESLEKNNSNLNYEWKNTPQVENIETLNIELPISNEIEWELFSDSNFKDKGIIKFSDESNLNNRLLTFKINPDKDGNNFFIELRVLRSLKNNLTDETEQVYQSFKSFISLEKLKQSYLESN